MKAAQSIETRVPCSPVEDPDLKTAEPAQAGDRAHYEIRYCSERHYLQIRLIGLWDEAIFARFAQRYLAVMHELADAGGITHALLDARQFKVQPPAVAEAFPALVRSAPHRPDQRTASVVGTILTRVQARPGGDVINARYFRTLDDARDWLFGDEA